MKTKKKLKVGVLGLGRGGCFIQAFEQNPYTELVAVCDFNKTAIDIFQSQRKDVHTYTDYSKFLQDDLDAVAIANYCTEHAGKAIEALNSGKHVLSEVIACKTLAEGVALCRAVEKSGKVYMFAENYCFFNYIQEMQRLYKRGVIGEYRYGECEYIHDCRPIWHLLIDGPGHWRNWLPSTYYCTHSIGPIISITGTRPVKVTGYIVPNLLGRTYGRIGDDWGILMCTMDNRAVTRVIPWSTGPRDSIWYRIYGTKGTMENNRLRDTEKLNLYFEKKNGKFCEKSYVPKFPHWDAQAKKATHGGSDFFITTEFVNSIINNTKPPIDVYQAMDMTLPGIIGYRSAYQGNITLEIPDFRSEEIRKKYENDHWSPDPKDRNIPNQPYPSVLGEIKIPDSVYAPYLKKRELAQKTVLNK